jgi:hypothetical protein
MVPTGEREMVSDDRPLGEVEVLVAEGGNGPASGLGERLADLGCFVLPAAVSAADALALLDTFRPDARVVVHDQDVRGLARRHATLSRPWSSMSPTRPVSNVRDATAPTRARPALTWVNDG